MGGKGSGGYTEQPESATERRLREAQANLLDKRMGGLTAGYNPRAFGFNENISDTTATSANPEYARIQNEIKNVQARIDRGYERGQERFGREADLRSLTSLQSQLASTPDKLTTGGKTSTFTPMSEAERIAADPSYAQQVASQTAFDANLGQVGTEIDNMSNDIKDLISKYTQFDTDTKDEILKLTGYTDTQVLELSNAINTLRPLQTQAAGLTQKAGLTLEDLMSGRMPGNLKPYYTEAMEAEKERLGRMGVSRDARLEGITRAGTKTALDLMTPYQNIYGANMINTRGLTSDIAGYGQAKLTNRTGLSDTAMRYRTQGTQNWGNIPVLRGNVATQRMGLTNAYGQRASYYNQLQQQNRDNLRTLSNWYGQ